MIQLKCDRCLKTDNEKVKRIKLTAERVMNSQSGIMGTECIKDLCPECLLCVKKVMSAIVQDQILKITS